MMLKATLPALMALAFALAPVLAGRAEAQQGLMTIKPETRARIMEAGRICRPDIERHCNGVKRGEGRIVQCLGKHRAELKPDCVAAMKAVTSQ